MAQVAMSCPNLWLQNKEKLGTNLHNEAKGPLSLSPCLSVFSCHRLGITANHSVQGPCNSNWLCCEAAPISECERKATRLCKS